MNDSMMMILTLSLSGSIMAVLWLMLQPLLKNKLSKKMQYVLWIVILMRFLIPVSYEKSLMNEIFYQNRTEKDTIRVDLNEYVPEKEPMSNQSNRVASDPVVIGQHSKTGLEVTEPDQASTLWYYTLGNNILFLWLTGAIVVFLYQLVSYYLFLSKIRSFSSPPETRQMELLQEVTGGSPQISLELNGFVTTPMLVGLRNPCIILPEYEGMRTIEDFELKNILRHELTHLKHLDLLWKWMMMLTICVHWFNPLIYLIRKQMNRACELACDETVIIKFSTDEKQAYGETLITLSERMIEPRGGLQATMCEGKRGLKERLLAIMQSSKRSRIISLLSVLIVLTFAVAGVALGAGVGYKRTTPPDLAINAPGVSEKKAMIEEYQWKFNQNTGEESYRRKQEDRSYTIRNTVSATGREEVILSLQEALADKFTLEDIKLYRDNQLIQSTELQAEIQNQQIHMISPEERGLYQVYLALNFPDRGKVNYRFSLMVGRMVYDLEEIAKYKNPYVGNHSKDFAIAGNLPLPDRYFMQQYISLQTAEPPYGMTIYYEPAKEGTEGENLLPESGENSALKENSELNALVVFCMIDNVDHLTFAFRNTKSQSKLDESAYKTSISFTRSQLEKKYGDLSSLGNDLSALQKLL